MPDPAPEAPKPAAFPWLTRELQQRVVSAAIAAALAMAVLVWGTVPFAILLAAIGAAMSWEWCRIVRGCGADHRHRPVDSLRRRRFIYRTSCHRACVVAKRRNSWTAGCVVCAAGGGRDGYGRILYWANCRRPKALAGHIAEQDVVGTCGRRRRGGFDWGAISSYDW